MPGSRSSFRASPAFVSRGVEQDWLETRLQLAASGQPQVALIRGDAGIGKTRLVREIEGTATRAGFEVYHGRAREGLTLPYLVFEPLLAALALGDPGQRAHESSGEADAPDASKSGAERLRLFQRIALASFARARNAPQLVVLEDLHWADEVSLDLLAHLTYAASDAALELPLAIVTTFRSFEGSERLGQVLERIDREEACFTLELAGLDERGVEAMIRACGVEEPSRQLVARVAEVTHGNPLFVQEILYALEREGALFQRGGRWLARNDPAEVRLPEHVIHAVAARIAELSAPCREALVTAACFGERFSVDELQSFVDSRTLDLRARLDEALRAGILAVRRDRLTFAHPLMRQALYGSLGPLDRQRLHRQIAIALERQHADDLEDHISRIAHHWIQGQEAGDAEMVVRHARRAGDRAFALFASAEAARCYEAALAAGDATTGPADRELAELHLWAGMAHYRNMDARPCLEHFAHAIELFERAGDLVGLTRSLIEQARTRFTLAPVAYGTLIDTSELERALERLEDEQPALCGWIYSTLTDAYMHGRRPDQAEHYARRAHALAEQLGDERLLAAAAVTIGTVHGQRLEARLALEAYRKSRSIAVGAEDPWVEGWALQRLPLALVWLGHLDEAEDTRREATLIARQTGDWADHSIAMGTGAALAGLRGDFAGVEREARETMAMVRRSGYPWGGVLALSALFAARAARGEWQEAEDALSILLEPGRIFEDGGPAAQAIASMGRLRLRALTGRIGPEEREQIEGFSKAMQLAGPEIGTIGILCALVEIADLIGDHALALAQLPALEVAERGGVVFAGGGEFLLARVQGVALSLDSRWDAAERYFENAIVAARGADARPDLARAELDFARMRIARGGAGDQERAAAQLLRSTESFRELAMAPFQIRAGQLARELGAAATPLRREQRADPDEPTPRQREILEAIAHGRSRREIADALLLSEATIASQSEALFAKLGVEGRTGATAYAFERGLARPQGARPRARPRDADARAQQIIFVSDIEQSTELIQQLGDAAAQQLIHVHNRIVRACVREHGGAEIQHTGDGFIVSFDSAPRAVECAIAIQRELARRNRATEGAPLRVRIGLNAGTPLPEEGRLFGVAMNLAARVCSRSAPEEIQVSEAVRTLCEGSRLAFAGAGEAVLKGIEKPVLLHRVVWEADEAEVHTGV